MAVSYIDRPGGGVLAYRRITGRGPCVVFLPGLGGGLTGKKASALAAWCEDTGRPFLAVGYTGHGGSSGSVLGTPLSEFLTDALYLIEALTVGPVVLVGASMGGWLSVLIALERPDRVRGLVGVAVAPDLTDEVIAKRLSAFGRGVIKRLGLVAGLFGSRFGVVTRGQIEDGKRHGVLGRSLPVSVPARFLHGTDDEAVPHGCAERLAASLQGGDVDLRLLRGGDHSLSREQDIAAMLEAVRAVCCRVDVGAPDASMLHGPAPGVRCCENITPLFCVRCNKPFCKGAVAT